MNTFQFNTLFPTIICLLVALCGLTSPIATSQEKKDRTLFVPFEDLDILFDGNSQHVYLTKNEYEELLKKSKVRPTETAPREVVYSSVVHEVSISGELATVQTRLKIETLSDRLHAIPIPFQGVYLQSATLANGNTLPLGKNKNGQTIAFLNGKQTHELSLVFVGVVKLDTARQSLQVLLPPASSSELNLTVDGNVELASGAAVVNRAYDQAGNQTRFQLVASRDTVNLVLSVNNKKLQEKKSILAKSVFIHELTSNYEQIHARVNVDILYGSTDEVKFELPEDFQITEVSCPEISNWSVTNAADHSILVVRLRDSIRKSFSLNIAATSTKVSPDNWQLRQLKPIDFSGSVSVVGIVAEERFELKSLDAQGLFAIDNGQIQSSIPATVFKTTTGAPAIATVAAFYAPDADFSLKANFATPPALLKITPTSILFLSDRQQKLIGQYQLAAEHEKAVNFELIVPEDWRVTSLKGEDGKPMPFQRNQQEGRTRLDVRIPGGLQPGNAKSIVFEALNTSAEWTKSWEDTEIIFPRFDIADSTLQKGAIGVAVEDDLVVRPKETKSLETLLKEQKSLFGLESFNTSLTFEIINNDFNAVVAVKRLSPQITATAFNFFRLLNKQIAVDHEIAFEIQAARSRTLSFVLPKSTPTELRVRGLNGVRIAQTDSVDQADSRTWTVELAEPSLGEIRLAIDYLQPLDSEEPKGYSLPLIKADSVGYQTSLVAFEGNPDFDVQLKTRMRQIDVGEMGDAQFVPGARLLGAYSAAGPNANLAIDVSRRNIHQLPTTIIESVSIQTIVANNGQSQSFAEYNLITKAPYIELKLPPSAKLWAAQLDGVPTRPQVRDDSILISLPPDSNRNSRKLSVLYEDLVSKIGLSGKVKLAAPRLILFGGSKQARGDVPQADLKWKITLPSGYTITSNNGTVFTTREERRALPFETVGRTLLQGIAFQIKAAREADNTVRTAEAWGDASDGAMEPQVFGGNAYVDEMEEEFDLAIDPNSVMKSKLESKSRSSRTPAPRKDAGLKEMPASGGLPEAQSPDEGRISDDDDKNEATSDQKSSTEKSSEAIKSKNDMEKWFQKGIAGLTVSEIPLEVGGETTTFELESLGNQANLSITIVDQDRIEWMAFAYGGLVIAFGLFLCRFHWKHKMAYLMFVIMTAAVVPMLGDWTQVFWGGLENSLYACCFLVLAYVIYAIASLLFRFLFKDLARLFRWMLGLSNSQMTTSLMLLLVLGSGTATVGQDAAEKNSVEIPDDAIIVPYDPQNPDQESNQIFVPYARYIELLKIADPEKLAATAPLPADFGWSSANYQATLSGKDLVIQGTLELECFTEQEISVPLNLDRAVLTNALLDKKPAQLKVVANQTASQKKSKKPPAATQLLLLTGGKGKKSLELELRIKANQTGGWKAVAAKLPVTPASKIKLSLPESGSELNYRIGKQTIKFVAEPNENVATLPMSPDGLINLSWREKVMSTKVDQNLSLNSTALFDVRNDGLHLVWNLDFLFRASKRSNFEVELPKDFSVVRVYGQNIRGWETREEPQAVVLDVTLLSEADSKENFTIELSNRKMDLSSATSFPMPTVVIPDAAIHSGQITVRKSDSLDLQTDTMIGISRIDLSEARQVKPKNEPLFNPSVFQAFEFSRTPFSVAIRCRPKRTGVEVRTRSLVDIRQKSCGLDTQIICSTLRPVHELTIQLPLDLDIQNVVVPSQFRKSVSRNEVSQTLKLFFASGLRGNFGINVSGRLQDHEETGQIPLPNVSVDEAISQSGEISAIAEPQLIIQAIDLENCESVLLSSVRSWLNNRNRGLARVALIHKSAEYAGNFQVTKKTPVVTATSVSNVNVTLRSIEESVMISFEIRDAGVDELVFEIPAELKDSRMKADLVREKQIEPIGDAASATRYRVTLQLQDFVIGQYRVLFEQDRGLSAEKLYAPLPSFENGIANVDRFVTIQNSGFDELLVKESAGLEKLDRRQKPFRDLKNLVGGADFRQAYIVNGDVETPVLSYQTNPRQLVETVGASIGLSEIVMTIDRSGGYRAEQKLYLDNRTEPFLEVEMPSGSRLWTVQVAGSPVKPIAIDGDDSAVRIPLIKTADGDSDFLVEIKYGGSVGKLENLSKLSFPFTKTRNINVAASNVKLNLPEDFDFWWFEGTLGVSEEEQINQAKTNYETALFSKLRLQAKNSKSELVRQRAAQNLSLIDNSESNATNEDFFIDLQKAEAQVDNRDRLNSVYEGQRIMLFGNSGNVSNTYGGNFGVQAGKDPGVSGKAGSEFNDKWLGSNGLVNPKVLEQNRQNQRFNAPSFNGKVPQSGSGAGGGGFGGGRMGQNLQGQQQAQREFQKQVVDNLNVLQEQSRKARRGENKKDAILRSYRNQLNNRGGALNPGDVAGAAPNQATRQKKVEQAEVLSNLHTRPPAGNDMDLDGELVDVPASMQTGSLNISFNHRGQSYLFQAPSGQLELEVTVVSKSLQRRSVNFFVLLGIVCTMGCTIWFFGGRKRRQR